MGITLESGFEARGCNELGRHSDFSSSINYFGLNVRSNYTIQFSLGFREECIDLRMATGLAKPGYSQELNSFMKQSLST